MNKATKDSFILIAGDANGTFVSPGYDVALYRLNNTVWGLNARTRHIRDLCPGSKALIYISGTKEFSQHFIAQCKIAGRPRSVPLELREKIDAPRGNGHQMPCLCVPLAEIEVFNHPVSIRQMLEKLAVIKKPEQWWRYLQGGVIRISNRDFNTVSRMA
jgi:hypothetical protein